MTTKEAAIRYLGDHLRSMQGKGVAVFNPHGLPVDDLPVIFCFLNSGSGDWLEAVALSDDGVCLGNHACSDVAYIPHDLGVLEGTRTDRHEEYYQKHYPDGYRMEYVSAVDAHDGLRKAIGRAKMRDPHQGHEGD